jgi:hypothetical protein
VTDQAMDFRDWLILRNQPERIAQRFDALFTKDEDHAAAATQGIENQAYYDVQESLTDVITQTRDLHAQIQSGIVPEKDARELLADLGRQLAKLVGKVAPTKSRHDSAQATLKDPAAKREALIARFPGAPQVVDDGR